LSNGNGYSGVTTDTLTITGAGVGLSGNRYRAVFSSASPVTATTTAASLTVNPSTTSHSSVFAASAEAFADTAYVEADVAFVSGHGSSIAYVYALQAYDFARLANYFNSIGNSFLTQIFAAQAYKLGYIAWNDALADYNRTGNSYSLLAYTYGQTAWNYSYLTSAGQ
jgi:hypothetical protein